MESRSVCSDEQLCVQAQKGDRLAEEQLVTGYARLVRIYARPYFLAGGDSEDLLQEGMIGLLSAIREFQAERNVSFRVYASTCIQNRLRSAVRSASRNKHGPLNDSVSLMDTLFDSAAYDPQTDFQRQEGPEEHLIRREEESRQMEILFDSLSAFERTVLALYLDGLSRGEIAGRVRKPVKSVENAIQRIRRKIAPCFPIGDFSVS